MRTLLLLAVVLSCALVQPHVVEAQANQPYRVDDAVSIQWRGDWYPGKILAVDGNRFQIRYDGYGAFWDEWVTAERLRRPGATPAIPTPAAPAPPPAAPPPAQSPAQPATAPPAPPAPAPQTGLHGTWRYQSWITTRPGQARGEIVNSDVTYWLTVRPNGTWSLSSTTRWSPNSPDGIAGGRYTLTRGELVLTQSGTPARTYGRYRVQENAADQVTLREAATGDVIVLRRGRG
jgi:hypothetical protein